MANVDSKKCPFCDQFFALTKDYTYKENDIVFEPGNTQGESKKNSGTVKLVYNSTLSNEFKETVKIKLYFCLNCKHTSLEINSDGGSLNDNVKYSYPEYAGKKYPEYVPHSIRNDYEEACKIYMLSPKASATLSRRCLQSIIRCYWEINEEFWQNQPKLASELRLNDITKPNLWQEIIAVEKTKSVNSNLIRVFKALKDIGNIGAHAELSLTVLDINPNEAKTMIDFLEILIESTYIKRFEDDEVLSKVLAIDSDKKAIKCTSDNV